MFTQIKLKYIGKKALYFMLAVLSITISQGYGSVPGELPEEVLCGNKPTATCSGVPETVVEEISKNPAAMTRNKSIPEEGAASVKKSLMKKPLELILPESSITTGNSETSTDFFCKFFKATGRAFVKVGLTEYLGGGGFHACAKAGACELGKRICGSLTIRNAKRLLELAKKNPKIVIWVSTGAVVTAYLEYTYNPVNSVEYICAFACGFAKEAVSKNLESWIRQ